MKRFFASAAIVAVTAIGIVLAGVPAANAETHNSYSCPNAPEGSFLTFSKKEATQWLNEGLGPCTNTVTGKTL